MRLEQTTSAAAWVLTAGAHRLAQQPRCVAGAAFAEAMATATHMWVQGTSQEFT